MRQPEVTRSRPSRPYSAQAAPTRSVDTRRLLAERAMALPASASPSCEPSPPSGRRPRPLSSSSPAKASSRPWHPGWSNATRDICGSFIPCLPQWWRRARPQGNGVSCTDASPRSRPTRRAAGATPRRRDRGSQRERGGSARGGVEARPGTWGSRLGSRVGGDRGADVTGGRAGRPRFSEPRGRGRVVACRRRGAGRGGAATSYRGAAARVPAIPGAAPSGRGDPKSRRLTARPAGARGGGGRHTNAAWPATWQSPPCCSPAVTRMVHTHTHARRSRSPSNSRTPTSAAAR